MPINESTARRTTLTPQQIQENERAIFGPPRPPEKPVEDERNKIKTIDLNKPPIRCVLPDGTESDQYRYQEYPRMLFWGGDPAQFMVVQNGNQFEAALKRGYTTEVVEYEIEPEAEPEEHDDEAFRAYLAEQAKASDEGGAEPGGGDVPPESAATPGKRRR